MFEDEFPFPKVGYVSFLEGTTPKISQFRSIINHHTWCNPHIVYTLFCLSTRFYHHVVWDSKIWGTRKFMEIWSLFYIYRLIFRFHWPGHSNFARSFAAPAPFTGLAATDAWLDKVGGCTLLMAEIRWENQLRLVVYLPLFTRFLARSQVVCSDFWTINSREIWTRQVPPNKEAKETVCGPCFREELAAFPRSELVHGVGH